MSSGFISETELASQRQKRQEEWEKVRTEEQPVEAPEEEYDPRSLFDRLQEQKQKKEFEYEEAHKLKNMIKGLDDDEVEFLDLVDQSKFEEERRKYLEESKALDEFRKQRACIEEEDLQQRIRNEIKPSKPTVTSSSAKISSQSKLLAGALVKKPSSAETRSETGSKRKLEEERDTQVKRIVTESSSTASTPSSSDQLQCVAILPGIGDYEHSTDSDGSSSDFETETTRDLCGRKIVKKKMEEEAAAAAAVRK